MGKTRDRTPRPPFFACELQPVATTRKSVSAARAQSQQHRFQFKECAQQLLRLARSSIDTSVDPLIVIEDLITKDGYGSRGGNHWLFHFVASLGLIASSSACPSAR